MLNSRYLLFGFLLFAVLHGHIAHAQYAGSKWYKGKGDGWFFYDDPIKEQKVLEEPKVSKAEEAPEKEEKKEDEIIIRNFPDSPVSEISDGGDKGPAEGSVVWIKENLPKVINIAIDNPTDKNVRRAAYIHKDMERKANKFSEKWVAVHSTDPRLDQNNGRAATSGITETMGKRMRANMKDVLQGLGDEVALAFFFDPNDAFTNALAMNVDYIKNKYDLDVLAVSVTGEGLNGGYFPSFVKDKGQAHALGIKKLPALYMYINSQKKWVPISENYLDTGGIETRLISHSHHFGVITDEQYNSTRSDVAPDVYFENVDNKRMVETDTESPVKDPYKNYFENLIGEGA